jgi:hypothetical protein
MTLHVDIVFRVGFSLKVFKSPMAYLEMNLNMGIAFKARYSYMYLLSLTRNLALIFLIINKICNKPKIYICFLPFGNIFKLNFFTFFRKDIK